MPSYARFFIAAARGQTLMEIPGYTARLDSRDPKAVVIPRRLEKYVAAFSISGSDTDSRESRYFIDGQIVPIEDAVKERPELSLHMRNDNPDLVTRTCVRTRNHGLFPFYESRDSLVKMSDVKFGDIPQDYLEVLAGPGPLIFL